MATDSELPHKARRHRSPNYPGISLKSAIEKITVWYKADGIVASPTEAAMKHMKGDYGRVVSALKSFGLINEENNRIKLSQRGIDVVVRPTDDPKHKQALTEAALSPSIYRDLVNEYTNGLPSDMTLQSELIAGRKFNPKFVADFITDFRATLEFAGIYPSAVVDSIQKGLEADGSFLEESSPVLPADELNTKSVPIAIEQPRSQTKAEAQQQALLKSGLRQDVFSLDEGVVTIQWPESISAESFEDLADWLDILKRKIGRSVSSKDTANNN